LAMPAVNSASKVHKKLKQATGFPGCIFCV